MKNLMYFIFSLFFNFYARFFPKNDKRVVLMVLHNEGENGSLSQIACVLEDFGEYEITRFRREELFSGVSALLNFFFVKSRILATASYVFLNDNFMPLRYMKFKKDVRVVQLWHGEGAFKRFGLGQKQDERTKKFLVKGNRNLTDVIVTSKKVIPIYAEAFGVDESKVKAYGSPRTDLFFNITNEEKLKLKSDFIKKYPQCAGKKLVLYAPTFRDDEENNNSLFSAFPFEEWEDISGEYALLVRAHPQVGGSVPKIGGFINVSDYPSVSELTLICDLLITDYSSIAMDFAIQKKPSLFFAFDLDYYCNEERGFYFPYEDYVPGKVVKSGKELIQAIKNGDFREDKTDKFLAVNFDYTDKYSARRIAEKILH